MYYDYRQHFELLADNEKGILFMALLDYGENGVIPDFNGALKMAFSFIKANLDRDYEKWEKTKSNRSEAGKKGMENRWGDSDEPIP